MDTKDRAIKIFGAIGLVTGVVILLALAGLITGAILGSSTFADTITTGTNSNETLLAVNDTITQDFAILSTFPNAVCVLSTVYSDGDVLISAANYTQPTTCQLLAVANSEYNNTNWNATYDFTNTQSNTAGINITELSEGFSGFVTGIVAFLAIIGLIIGIVWLISYLKSLFSKDEGIQSFSGN